MDYSIRKAANGYVVDCGHNYDDTLSTMVFTKEIDLQIFLGKIFTQHFEKDGVYQVNAYISANAYTKDGVLDEDALTGKTTEQ